MEHYFSAMQLAEKTHLPDFQPRKVLANKQNRHI